MLTTAIDGQLITIDKTELHFTTEESQAIRETDSRDATAEHPAYSCI